MFSDIWNKIKELIRKVLPKKSIEEVLQINPIMSDRMADSIQLWSDMYVGNSPWLKEPTPDNPTRIVSLGLPALIASEKARMVTLEMKSEISAPMQDVPIDQPVETADIAGDSGSSTNINTPEQPSLNADDENTIRSDANTIPMSTAFQQKSQKIPTGPVERAEFLNKQYKKLLKQIRRQLEYGIAKGGLIIKPYIKMYSSNQNAVNTNQNSTDSSSSASDNTSANTDNKNENTSNFTQRGKLLYNKDLPIAEIEFDFVQADRFSHFRLTQW